MVGKRMAVGTADLQLVGRGPGHALGVAQVVQHQSRGDSEPHGDLWKDQVVIDQVVP